MVSGCYHDSNTLETFWRNIQFKYLYKNLTAQTRIVSNSETRSQTDYHPQNSCTATIINRFIAADQLHLAQSLSQSLARNRSVLALQKLSIFCAAAQALPGWSHVLVSSDQTRLVQSLKPFFGMMRLNPHVHVPVNLNFFSIRVNKVVVQVVAYTTSIK